MKMLMILCTSARLQDAQKIIDQHKVEGYSEILDVRGAGITGKHMGSRAWPGSSSIIFTVLEDAKAVELIAALKELAEQCAPEEGLRMFVLPVEQMV